MKEKILEKLKKQRGQNSQITDKSLEDLTSTLSIYITTDDLLENADFSETINSLQSNINHVVAESVKKVQAKQKEDPEKQKKEKPLGTSATEKPDDIPTWVNDLVEKVTNLSAQVNTLSSEKLNASRLDRFSKKLTGFPKYQTNLMTQAFNNMKFENDEDFETYLTSLDANLKDVKQAMEENGVVFNTPSTTDVSVPENDLGTTPEIKGAFDILDKAAQKNQKT